MLASFRFHTAWVIQIEIFKSHTTNFEFGNKKGLVNYPKNWRFPPNYFLGLFALKTNLTFNFVQQRITNKPRKDRTLYCM